MKDKDMQYIYKVDELALRLKGIYRIDFGKYNFYIGKTEESFGRRWNKHISSFNHGTCNHIIWELLEENPYIQIVFSIVKVLEDNIKEWEAYYIEYLKPNLNVQHPKCRGINPRCT